MHCVACSGHTPEANWQFCCFCDSQINVKERPGSKRQCWLDSAVCGDSAGGRGLLNGSLGHGVPDLQVPRCAPSRAPRVLFGAWSVCVGVLVTVARTGGEGGVLCWTSMRVLAID